MLSLWGRFFTAHLNGPGSSSTLSSSHPSFLVALCFFQDEVEDMTQWFRKYGDDVQKFAALKTPQESHKFLLENMHLVCDHMASYLVIFCVDLEVEEVRCAHACGCWLLQLQCRPILSESSFCLSSLLAQKKEAVKIAARQSITMQVSVVSCVLCYFIYLYHWSLALKKIQPPLSLSVHPGARQVAEARPTGVPQRLLCQAGHGRRGVQGCL